MPNVVDALQEKMAKVTEALEGELNADVVGLFGPILSGLEHRVRSAIETLPAKRAKLAVVLTTPGGSIEVTERIVNLIRYHYPEVIFIVPDVAMSAGTVLAMSGDAIMMNYFSCLGPIDPQVERDGRLVPALSYLEQFNNLVAKGSLTTAELALLNKLDLAELHVFEQVKHLTEELLVGWLAKYKFKNWVKTATQQVVVDQQKREARAREIAQMLNDHQRWKSHGRSIPMQVLRDEVRLQIDDFSATPALADAIRDYCDYVASCMVKEQLISFVTSRSFV